jgi:hypothetical protein
MAYQKLLSWLSPGETEENNETSASITGNLEKIGRGYLFNINLEPFCYIMLLCEPLN